MMKNTSKLVMIAALVMMAVLVLPVMAQDACIVPPDEYFVTDGAHNGAPVHEGIQNGFIFWMPAKDGSNHYAGQYLHITEFKLKQSHEEQIKIAMGKLYYCDSIPDFPYEASQVTFTSENPSTSTYAPAHASAIFR